MSQEFEAEDVFGQEIRDLRRIVFEAAGHYPYSPERWRLFKNGSRVFPEYGSVAEYTHADSHHELSPGQGDTFVMESRRRATYVVQYELMATWACQLSRSLEPGDEVRMGFYSEDPNKDGWLWRHTGSDHDDQHADLQVFRDGSLVAEDPNQDLRESLLNHARLRIETPWYDVGRTLGGRSFPEHAHQQNPIVARLDTDGERGPLTANQPLRFEVVRDSDTPALSLEVGSAAVSVTGGQGPNFRPKQWPEDRSVSVSDGTSWEPLVALRTDPDRPEVLVQLSHMVISEYGGQDVVVAAQAFDDSKVADSNGDPLSDANFSTPEPLNPTSTVIETNPNVAQVADRSGSLTTNPSQPGGWNVAMATRKSAGAGSSADRSKGLSGGETADQPISPRDYVVLLARADSTGTVSVDMGIEEDW